MTSRPKLYSSKKYVNPYFRAAKKPTNNPGSRVRKSTIKWRNVFIALLLLLLLIGIFWGVFKSGYFTINDIQIKGLSGIPENEILDIVENQEKSLILAIFPQKNLIFFSKNGLISAINRGFNLEKLEINKKFPNKLEIIIEEKKQAAIWRELDKYFYINNVGSIIKEITPTDVELASGTLPLIENRGSEKIQGRSLIDQSVNIQYVLQTSAEYANGNHGFFIDKFIVDNDLNTIKMAVRKGPTIYLNTTRDLSEQITRLDILIKNNLKDDFFKKSYIDLRFGEVINYK